MLTEHGNSFHNNKKTKYLCYCFVFTNIPGVNFNITQEPNMSMALKPFQ